MVTNLYTYEGVAQILRTEEKNGRLRENTYRADSGVLKLSQDMKTKRNEIKHTKKDARGELRLELHQLQEKYRIATEKEFERIAKEISGRSFQPKLSIKTFEKETYVALDTNTLVVSKIIARELQHAYRLKPQNRDTIVEQLRGLLDGTMPKVVLRADVCDFYESIPQELLKHRIEADGKISSYSIKYLRSFMYAYNEICPNSDDEPVGLPRGLAFSAYLSELYMQQIDAEISAIPGVYFYKRYVDDIVIVADPDKGTPQAYWNKLNQIIIGAELTIHDDSEKAHAALWDKDVASDEFTYLGYKFKYSKGCLDVLLSQKREDKYRMLIDALFEIYEECALGKAWKYNDKRKEALHQLIARLRVLTGNGLLRGRKCFVASGVYYTNKFITDTKQLEELDRYLCNVIDNRFNPPTCLYNYKEGGDHATNVQRIKEKLKSFSFVQSFQAPKLINSPSYEWELMQLRHIYLNRRK
jgi:hypothetical protein